MFDLPARFNQDEKYYAVSVKTRAHFREAEEQELQSLKREGDEPLKYSELREELSLDPQDGGFIGFVSQGIYNESGELVGDTVSAAMTALGRNHQPRKYTAKKADWRTNPWGANHAKGFSASQQQAVVLQAGLELLPRSACAPIVRRECARTQQLVGRGRHQLSDKAQSILKRTNYRRDRSLMYDLRGDVWSMGRRMLRRRTMQTTATILWTSLERGDHARAHEALGVLLRCEGIIMRNLWMPAMELLAWEQSRKGSSRTSRTPIAFLDWLIVNYPTLPHSGAIWRKIPRAENFRPLAIMDRLVNGDYRGALERAEEAILTIPSSVDPLCWALAGLAALKAEYAIGVDRTQDAHRYFRRCIELGGVLPRELSEDIKNGVTHITKRELVDEDMEPERELESEGGPESELEAESVSEPEHASAVELESGLEVDSAPGSRRNSDAGGFSQSDADSANESETPIKRESSHATHNGPFSPEHSSLAETETPHDIKAEALSQLPPATQSQSSALGVTWDDSDSEDDESTHAPVVKLEIPTQNVQSQGLSQGSTLGASWSDSDSEES